MNDFSFHESASSAPAPSTSDALASIDVAQSADAGALFKALLAVQKALPKIRRNKVAKVRPKNGGQAYEFRYADLDQIMDKVRPVLNKAGILVTHPAIGGRFATRLIHVKTQQYMESSVPLPFEDIHRWTGATTTLRRYMISQLLGLVPDDDDDGNAAAGNDRVIEDVSARRARPASIPRLEENDANKLYRTLALRAQAAETPDDATDIMELWLDAQGDILRVASREQVDWIIDAMGKGLKQAVGKTITAIWYRCMTAKTEVEGRVTRSTIDNKWAATLDDFRRDAGPAYQVLRRHIEHYLGRLETPAPPATVEPAREPTPPPSPPLDEEQLFDRAERVFAGEPEPESIIAFVESVRPGIVSGTPGKATFTFPDRGDYRLQTMVSGEEYTFLERVCDERRAIDVRPYLSPRELAQITKQYPPEPAHDPASPGDRMGDARVAAARQSGAIHDNRAVDRAPQPKRTPIFSFE